MSEPQNRAAWVLAKQAKPFTVGPATMPTPQANEIIIRVAAISINPADWAIQEMGIIVSDYPSILGYDAAGTVFAVGSDITNFKIGDRVTTVLDGADPGETRGKARAGMQLYTAANAALCGKLPEQTSFIDGCILPLCLTTAATPLYMADKMALALPNTATKPNSVDQIVVIWGVGSAVGSCAVQLVKASGYEVAATASEHNLEYARSLGADYVFDYKKASVAGDIIGALRGKKSAGVFNSVTSPESMTTCGQIASELDGKKFLGTVIPPGMDVPGSVPSDVTVFLNWGTSIKNTHIGPYISNEWIPAALASGQLKCKPDYEVGGYGLEGCQAAVDRWAQGVSAKKIVVDFSSEK